MLLNYTPKRTKLHHLKKLSRGAYYQTPIASAWQRATRLMTLRGMQLAQTQKKVALPHPPMANPAYTHAISA